MYKETFPFENGWSHFHFTKRRFLFVLQNKEQGCPSAIFMAFGTAPLAAKSALPLKGARLTVVFAVKEVALGFVA
jgi:hypothetical protein